MADGAHDEATLDRYARAQARLEHAGGYNWRERALATLHGLGFRDDRDLDRQLDTFSGGELTRASLGRALAGDPDLLLLDEPTNHLDIASLEWLEQHLISLDAAVVLVAHDRWFLEAVGTAVLELEAGRGQFFAGPWHAWRKEKAARELALGRAIERQQAEIDRLERFVTRFRAGTRARQAQSRAKRLDKMERISRDPRDGAGLEFAFKPPERSGRVVFELEDACAAGRGQGAPARSRAVARAGRARLPGRRQRHRQDDPDRDPGRPARAARGQATHRPQREARLPVPARRGAPRRPGAVRSASGLAKGWAAPESSSCPHRARSHPARHRAHPRARPALCSASSCSPARRPRSPWTGCPEASGAGSRWPSWSTPAPTC